MFNRLHFIILLFIITSLVACLNLNSKNKTELGKNIEIVNWHQQKKNCNQQQLITNQCPTFKLNGITFKYQPLLNNLIEHKLLTLVNSPNNSLWNYQQNYLARAKDGDHIHFNITLLEQTATLIVLQLSYEEQNSNDSYTVPKITLINFNKKTQQDLQLTDIIKSDKISAFWNKAQIVYKQWLEINQLLNNETYQQDWPFVKTQNFALLPHGIALKYEANTLAPFALGRPTLVIPYNQLKDILKPQYENL